MQLPSSLRALLATSPLLLTIHANPIPQTTTTRAPMPTGFCDNPLGCLPQTRNLAGIADPFCHRAGGCKLPPIPIMLAAANATATAKAKPAPMPMGFCDNPLRCRPPRRNISGIADPFCHRAGGCILPPIPTMLAAANATATAKAKPAPMPMGFCDNPLRCRPPRRNISGIADPFCHHAGGCILPPLPTLTGTSTATTTALATQPAPLVPTHRVDTKCNQQSGVCKVHWGPRTMERRASPTKTEVMARDKVAQSSCPKATSTDMVVCLEGH
ncbi:hypothetical protein N7G274_005201 [Stereocaulon virgatum]|uniref:Uncharacterized protein n=1 Tax=Stereocaulon virgatum TaxID=373712 RepID=A0ABR4A8J7_9LECA